MAIFLLMNKILKIQTRWLFIHVPLKNHVERINCWPFSQFCVTAKCFRSSVVPDWKTAVWFFALCSKRSLQIAMLLAPGHNCAAFLVPVLWTVRNAHVMGNRWRNMATKLRTDHSCETLSVYYNKRKIGFILQRQRKGKKLVTSWRAALDFIWIDLAEN